MMDSGRDSPTHRQSKKNQATLESQTPPVNGGIPNLAEEMIFEILARLPVKSLLRFRCVSKSWLTLISSQQFIKTHLNTSIMDMSLSNYRIMLTICNPSRDLKHCPLSFVMHEPSTDACSIDYPNIHPPSAVRVIGSSDGLLCLVSEENFFFLWNPSTRKSRMLPPANFELKRGFSTKHCFGFYGFHDDYKVVAIFCMFRNVDSYKSIVKIYSLKTNSWKKVEDFKGGIPMDGTGKFASGKLHWCHFGKRGLDFNWGIISLDLETEVYDRVEQPHYYDEGDYNRILGVLGECICILCNYEISADLWVLKEYGVKESWTKVATVPFVDNAWNCYSQPLFNLPNGEILLVGEMRFVVYSSKDKSTRIHKIRNFEPFRDTNVYVESLVSPLAIGR